MPFSFRERPDLIKRSKNEIFDIIVIGGGITGAAVARNASLRGLRVLLLEANDFASGTSSGSSKLIHGGIRYLENFEFSLVKHAIHERESMRALYAPLVRELKFIFPTYQYQEPARWKLNAGLWLYNAFSGFKHPHQSVSKDFLCQRYPSLRATNLTGACIYDDAFAEDYRLVIELIKSAIRHSTIAISRAAVTSISQTSPSKGSLFALSVRDAILPLESSPSWEVRGRYVINCAGPFSEQIRSMLHLPRILTLTQGVHFIFSQDKLRLTEAFVLPDTKQHRILFVIPWGPIVYVGTTDTFIANAEEARATSADYHYVFEIFKRHFDVSLERTDILNSWAAVRPLIATSNDKSASSISRDFTVEENPKGFFHILGGKLTSHRHMAQTALNKMPGLSMAKDPTDSALLLDGHHFTQPSLKESVDHEMVLSTMDYLRRRSPLYYHEPFVEKARHLSHELRDLLNEGEDWVKKDLEDIEQNFKWDQTGY